jgi:hypothetical protein
LVSYISYKPICSKYKKSYIILYKYFSNDIIYEPIELDISKFEDMSSKITGYNNFCFIDRTFKKTSDCINKNNIINTNIINSYEVNFLNFIDLIDLPNNKKIFLKKIYYKSFIILLYEEGDCININTFYKFINISKLNNFFIIKENVYIKDDCRIKVLSSNLEFEPLRIESGIKKDFL